MSWRSDYDTKLPKAIGFLKGARFEGPIYGVEDCGVTRCHDYQDCYRRRFRVTHDGKPTGLFWRCHELTSEVIEYEE